MYKNPYEIRLCYLISVSLIIKQWGGRFKVWGSGFRVQGSGFRVQGSGFRVQGSGFRVQGSGFGVVVAASPRVYMGRCPKVVFKLQVTSRQSLGTPNP